MPWQLDRPSIDRVSPSGWSFEPFRRRALAGSIVDRFEVMARRFSARLAVSDSVTSLTYAELLALTQQVKAAIASATVSRAGPVAILLPTDVKFPAAMLGVLAAGRIYLPLDSDFPIERNRTILAESGACAVISSADLAAEARLSFPHSVPVIDLADLPAATRQQAGRRPGANDLAAILYTSGSTGTPKGVVLSHSGILQGTRNNTNATLLSCEDRVLSLSSPSTAAGNRVIHNVLLNGASLHLLPPGRLSAADLALQIRTRGITYYKSVPTMMRRIVEALDPAERLAGVRLVYLTADRVDWSDVDAVRRGFSDGVILYEGFGSTECGTYLHWVIDDALRPTTPQPPVGRPADDRTVTIVDDKGCCVADGLVGEIVVASEYTAIGHWHGAELKVRAFPTDATDARMRVIKTGDRGLRRSDGLIELVGRKDLQTKLRGHRIYPSEIERALRDYVGVSDAAIVVRMNKSGVPRCLVAYVELQKTGRGLPSQDIIAMLERSLPVYMIPSAIFAIDQLPRLPSLKLDRSRLQEIDSERMKGAAGGWDDPLLSEVARIFEQVIGIAGAMPDDNVASLGGDSLQAVNIALELETRFRVAIPTEIFKGMLAIRELAQWIVSHNPAARQVCTASPRPDSS